MEEHVSFGELAMRYIVARENKRPTPYALVWNPVEVQWMRILSVDVLRWTLEAYFPTDPEDMEPFWFSGDDPDLDIKVVR